MGIFVYIREKMCYTAIRMEAETMTISPRIHKIYAYVCGVAAVVAGICLMIACIGIWGAGDAPFNPGSVKAAFTPISIPVYLCLALVLGGMVLDAICPEDRKKPRAARQVSVLLKRQRVQRREQQVHQQHCHRAERSNPRPLYR